ncbi:MAG: thermonuclease family protein [Oxalobacter sp.]|nr:thermonuclease family protein [Oxalobacter sp.]
MRAFLVACFLALQMPFAFADWEGVVEEVVSGDTMKVNYEGGLYYVRLYGVASPKLSQPYGAAAKEAVSNLVLGRSVDVHRMYADGNTDVAIVYVHDQYSVQAHLAGAGLAWVHSGSCTDEICTSWQSMQQQARDASYGLWASANPVAPWNWKVQPTVKKKPVVVKKKKPAKRIVRRRVTPVAAPAVSAAEVTAAPSPIATPTPEVAVKKAVPSPVQTPVVAPEAKP